MQVVQKLNQAAGGSGGASGAPIEVLDLFASVESYCGQFTEKLSIGVFTGGSELSLPRQAQHSNRKEYSPVGMDCRGELHRLPDPAQGEQLATSLRKLPIIFRSSAWGGSGRYALGISISI